MKIIRYELPAIYRIRNIHNNHCYIGSAVNAYLRGLLHRSQLRANNHHSRYLQRAWKRHKEQSFVFEILESVQSKSMLIPREQWWMDTLHPAYNMNKKADSPLGRKMTMQQRLAMSKRMSGPNNPNLGSKRTLAQRKRMSDVQKRLITPERIKEMHRAMARKAKKFGWPSPMLGKHHSKPTRMKISKRTRGKNNPFYGKTHNERTRKILRLNWKLQIEKYGHPRLGTRHTLKTRKLMSKLRMGKPGPTFGPEMIKKLSEAKLGNQYALGCKRSAATRKRMSIAQRLRRSQTQNLSLN